MAQMNARLKKELEILKNSPPTGVVCWPEEDNITKIHAVIIGEEETVYENGYFKLEIEIPERYPFQPPKVRFMTQIYHPNIDTAGRICLDVLKMPPSGGWRPAHNVRSILMSIRILMATPNPDDPLMADIAEEYQLRRTAFDLQAREMTKKYASTNITNKNSQKSSRSKMKDAADDDDEEDSTNRTAKKLKVN